MNRLPFRFHPAAAEELIAAAAWLAESDARVAEVFVEAVDSAIQRVRLFPEAGATMGEGIRRYTIRRFQYLLIYRVVGDVVEILALAHGAREPGYWKSRTG